MLKVPQGDFENDRELSKSSNFLFFILTVINLLWLLMSRPDGPTSKSY